MTRHGGAVDCILRGRRRREAPIHATVGPLQRGRTCEDERAVDRTAVANDHRSAAARGDRGPLPGPVRGEARNGVGGGRRTAVQRAGPVPPPLPALPSPPRAPLRTPFPPPPLRPVPPASHQT